VARKSGKLLVETTSLLGPRQQRKTGEATEDLSSAFAMPTSLQGGVIVLDDVVRSGTSLSAVAIAARRAGAMAVSGFAAVKTMRS